MSFLKWRYAAYAIPSGSGESTPERMRQFAAFHLLDGLGLPPPNRPGDTVSYTHNWPLRTAGGQPAHG